MRLGIFTQWYEPEPGPAALTSVTARALAERGHDVFVLTGFPNYPTGHIMPGYHQRPRFRELSGAVNILRVPLIPSHDSSALRRIANYASFGISAAIFGVSGLPHLDALWVNYSPVTLAIPMWIQQLSKGTPTICDVSDLWPDTIQVSGLEGASRLEGLGLRLLNRWCRAIYASSDIVTYISPGIERVLTRRGVPRERLYYLPKPADEEIFHPGGESLRRQLGIRDDQVVVSYAGAIGAAQGLESLIEASSRIEDPRLVILIAGSGTYADSLKRRIDEQGSTVVRFLGRLPREQMTDLMATSDVAYISLTDHPLSAVTMPSKTQAALASGRPILAAAPGDLAHLVSHGGLGYVAQPGNSESIAQALGRVLAAGRDGLARMGALARSRYLQEFSVRRTTDVLEQLLGEVSTRPRPRRSRLSPSKECDGRV